MGWKWHKSTILNKLVSNKGGFAKMKKMRTKPKIKRPRFVYHPLPKRSDEQKAEAYWRNIHR